MPWTKESKRVNKCIYTENFVAGLLCIIYILQYSSQARYRVNIPFKFQKNTKNLHNQSHIYKKNYTSITDNTQSIKIWRKWRKQLLALIQPISTKRATNSCFYTLLFNWVNKQDKTSIWVSFRTTGSLYFLTLESARLRVTTSQSLC